MATTWCLQSPVAEQSPDVSSASRRGKGCEKVTCHTDCARAHGTVHAGTPQGGFRTPSHGPPCTQRPAGQRGLAFQLGWLHPGFRGVTLKKAIPGPAAQGGVSTHCCCRQGNMPPCRSWGGYSNFSLRISYAQGLAFFASLRHDVFFFQIRFCLSKPHQIKHFLQRSV